MVHGCNYSSRGRPVDLLALKPKSDCKDGILHGFESLNEFIKMRACTLPSFERHWHISQTTEPTMCSFTFTQLFLVGTAFTGALAQFYDGYENVTTATTPVQIRLAYQGPTAMMGKEAPASVLRRYT
jgi:hypothetical protein